MDKKIIEIELNFIPVNAVFDITTGNIKYVEFDTIEMSDRIIKIINKTI